MAFSKDKIKNKFNPKVLYFSILILGFFGLSQSAQAACSFASGVACTEVGTYVWTVPAGVTSVTVELAGGGGGGGDCYSGDDGSNGGNSTISYSGQIEADVAGGEGGFGYDCYAGSAGSGVSSSIGGLFSSLGGLGGSGGDGAGENGGRGSLLSGAVLNSISNPNQITINIGAGGGAGGAGGFGSGGWVKFTYSSGPSDGVCGTSNGTTRTSIPSTVSEKCSAGLASAIIGTGPWTWSCNGIGGSTVNANCSANIQTYSLNFFSTAGGTLSGSTSQTINHGASATAVTSNPDSGFSFVNWTGSAGFVTKNNNPLTVTNVTANQNITANFAALTAPGAPTSPIATAGNALATINFTAPASNGGSTITGYTATASPGGQTGTCAGASACQMTINGLSNGTAYTFTVTATNAIGTSSASPASNSVTPVDATAPLTPIAPTAVAGNAQATVLITAPSNGGSPITGYTVTSSPAGGVDSNAGTTNLSHAITGLANGTAYTFTVTATNAIGTSSASPASNSVTPSGPYNITASAGTGGTISPASYSGVTFGQTKTFTVTVTTAGLTPVMAGTCVGTLTGSASPYTFTTSASNRSNCTVFASFGVNSAIFESSIKDFGAVTSPTYGNITWNSGFSGSGPYVYLSQWGGPWGSGDGRFMNSREMDFDSTGNIYIVDQSNSRVQKFSSTGTFITKWGTTGTGDGQFNAPSGIAVDSFDNVYITEQVNGRIQKFSSTGTFITKWGTAGAGDGQFNAPTGVAVDSSGNVYVVEYSNNRIQKFSSTGTFITKWGTSGSGDGQFNHPSRIAIDSFGNVYVTDSDNNRIQKFSSTGTFITKWGTTGTADGQFTSPTGITIDASGGIYVVEWNNTRVQKFSSTGTFITKWGTAGTGDGQFSSATDIASDSAGNIYVNDSGGISRIQKFNPGASFKMRVRTGTTSDGTGASWDAWSDLCNVTNGANVATGNVCVTNGDQYVQYQATLSTDTGTNVPVLSNVSIATQAEYSRSFLNLISVPFDSSNPFNSVQKITWGANNDDGSAGKGTVNFQIRTSPDNATWGQWCGPTTCGNAGGFASDYYTDKTGATAINAGQKDNNSDQWIQYATFLKSSDGAGTPTLSNVTIQYAYNVPPAISGVGYTQNSDGSVAVPYTLSETYDDLGTIAHGTASSAIKALLFFRSDGGVSAPALTNAQSGIITLTNTNSSPIPTQGMMLIDNELISFDSNGATGNQRNITGRAQAFDVSFTTGATSHSAGAEVYFQTTRKTDATALIHTINTFAATGSVGTQATIDNSFAWDPKNEPYFNLDTKKLTSATFKVVANDADSSGVNNVGSSSATGSQTLDFKGPTISSITTSTATGKYKAGTTIPLTVTFSENVNFNSAGGKTITLTLNSGICTIASSITNSSTSACSYVVGASENTPAGQYLKVSSISTNGSIIDAFANQQSDFTIPTAQNIDQNNVKQIVIDTVLPVISAGSDVTAKQQFSVTATATDTNGSGINGAKYKWSKVSGPGVVTIGTDSALTTTVSANADGAYVLKFIAEDNAGNSNSANMNFVWDTTAPTFDNFSDQLKNTAFTQNLSNLNEAGSGIESYVWSKKAGPGNVVFASPNSASTLITPNTDGNYVIKVVITDFAGNATTKEMNLTWDTIAPVLNFISSDKANLEYGIGEVIDVKAVFNESIADGSTMTVQLENSANPAVDVVLSKTSANILSGSFTVQGPRKGYDTDDLNVRSIVSQSVLDTVGNLRNDLVIPGGQNLANNKNISISTGTPILLRFDAKKIPENLSNGSYKEGAQFKITATYSKPIASGSITIHLNTDNGSEKNADVTLSTISGSTISGTAYVVVSDDNTDDLKVSSITAQSATDSKGNFLSTTGSMTDYDAYFYAIDNTILPVVNISNFQIDTTAPVLGSTPVAFVVTKTNSQTPQMNLSATDNFDLSDGTVRFSLNGGTSWCAPLAYANNIANFDITSVSCGGSSVNENKNVTVKFIDQAGNESGTASAMIEYDKSKPVLEKITAEQASGLHGPGDQIKIVAQYNETLLSGSSLLIRFDNAKEILLDNIENSNQLTGTYTIGSTGTMEDSAKLKVSSIVSQNVSDTAVPANVQDSTSLSGIVENIDTNKEIIVDTTAPVGNVVIDRSKNSGQITINATDSHSQGMQAEIVQLDSSVGNCTFANNWILYTDNINTSLNENTSSARKVCVRFKDQTEAGNVSDSFEASTPETPSGTQIDDISNSEIGFYGAMLTWQIPAIKGTNDVSGDPFKQYEVFKCSSAVGSTDECTQNTASSAGIIENINENYFVDTNLVEDTTYCYQVRFKDKHGDFSKLSANTCFQAGHAPAVNDSQVSIISGNPDDIQITDVTEKSAIVFFQTRDSKYNRPVATKAYIDVYTSPSLSQESFVKTTEAENDFMVVHTIHVEGLESGTQYYLKITAQDSSINGNPGKIGVLAYSAGGIPALTFTTLGTLQTITEVTESIVTESKAVITFVTDQDAKCFVDYKESTIQNYNDLSGNLEKDFYKNHSITLTQLFPQTKYDYKITCIDKNDVTISSDGHGFTTMQKGLTQGDVDAQLNSDKTAPEIGNVSLGSVTGESATITWNTNKVANSLLLYEVDGSTFSMVTGDADCLKDTLKYSTSHSVTVNGLIPGTKYLFNAMSADSAGNIAQSAQSSFTTKQPSDLSSIEVVSKSLGQATVTWETGSNSSSIVEYGLSTSYGQKKEDSAKTKSHSINLSGLEVGEIYHLRIKGSDENGNMYASSDITFRPKSPPKIENFKVDSVSEHGAVLTFNTNVPTDAIAIYTDVANEENSAFQGNPLITAKHELKIKELTSGTTFSISLKVKDEDGNETEEKFPNFTTTTDEAKPVIENVRTDLALAQNDKVQAIISWNTDEQSTTSLLYKEGRGGQQKEIEVSKVLTPNHVAVITSFKSGTSYFFNVKSVDASGNEAISSDYAMLTPRKKENIIQIIIGNFTDIFGWAKFK